MFFPTATRMVTKGLAQNTLFNAQDSKLQKAWFSVQVKVEGRIQHFEKP
jgi:hypothetical protein